MTTEPQPSSVGHIKADIQGGHPMQIKGHVTVDWSDEHVRPEVITQIDGSRGGYSDALHLVDIMFGRDPEDRPSDNNTLYMPDGYPESVCVRVTRHDADRLYKALGAVLRRKVPTHV